MKRLERRKRRSMEKYQDAALSPRERAEDLLEKMTLKEKVFIEIPSIVLIAIPPVRKSVRYIRRIVAAFFTVSSVILLPKK